MRYRHLALLVLLTSLPAVAVDLGTLGPVYPIAEPDLIQSIQAKAARMVQSGEWARVMQASRDRAIQGVLHPKPLPGLATVSQASTRYLDPSVTLDHAITDAGGHVLFPAGTRVNPLDFIQPQTYLLFFDGSDTRQVAKARALLDQYQGRLKPILTAGSFAELSKLWQRQVYVDQAGALTTRLSIQKVPALVSTEGRALRIDEIVP